MSSIWKIISNLFLAAIFIIFIIFSITEYSSDKINLSANEDRLPLARVVFSNINDLFVYFEKVSLFGLVPPVIAVVDYEKQVISSIDNQVVHTENNSNIKEDLVKNNQDNLNHFSSNMNWQDLWQRLKGQLAKDWSRP